MENKQTLNDKKILVVDDEPDILESLEELLEDTFMVDAASSFEEAVSCLKNNYRFGTKSCFFYEFAPLTSVKSFNIKSNSLCTRILIKPLQHMSFPDTSLFCDADTK